MMSSRIDPYETKAVGWYAVMWAHITDWYKAYGKRNSKDDENDKNRREFLEEEAYSTGINNYRKHAIEELDKPVIADIEEKKLKEAIKESKNILAKAKTVFPFTPFPSTITIDRHKLTIAYGALAAQQIVSVPIENIKNIQADLGPLFGSLTVTSDHFINNTQEVHFLKKKDAEKIQKMVQGAMVAVSEEIDLSKVESKKLRGYLESLGEGSVG